MKKEIIRKSSARYYMAGASWLIYSLLLPFYRMTDILVAAVLSAGVFFVSGKIFAPLREIVEVEEVFSPSGNRQADEMISKGQALLKQIREANQRINHATLSLQITGLEEVCRQIFKEIQRRPQKAPLIRRSLDYYLPLVLKLLLSYNNMEEQSVQGENVKNTMGKIENVMDTVLMAFHNQLDSLYKDEALDISTDITVLQGMLTQEGLLSDGLTVETKAGAAS